jgi:hypothetical protein
MSFINPADGTDVPTSSIGTHKLEWMRLPTAVWDAAVVAQPGWQLQTIHGTKVVEYHAALEWCSQYAVMEDDWTDKSFWRHRPEPSAVARCLGTALSAAGAQNVKMSMTKGMWLDFLEAGAKSCDAANAAALKIPASDIFELPDTPAVPMAVAADANAAAREAYEDSAALCWNADNVFATVITWGMLRNPSSLAFPLGGWLAYATSGVGVSTEQGSSGPWGKLASRVLADFQPGGYKRCPRGMASDVAAAVLGLMRGAEVPRKLMVQLPPGAERRQAAVEELRLADYARRGSCEAALFARRAPEVIANWDAQALAVRGERSAAKVYGMVTRMLDAAGIAGGASEANLDSLNRRMQQRKPLLRQPDTAAMAAAERSDLICDKLRMEARPRDVAVGGGGGGGLNQPVGAGAAGTGRAAARAQLHEKAATTEGFLGIMHDARQLWQSGEPLAAMQVLFTGKSTARPNGERDRLAIKLALGVVEPSDIDPDMGYAWISEVVSHGAEYLAHMVLQQFVRNGDISDDEIRAVRLDALWDAMRSTPGAQWGAKINLYGMLLKPVHEAVHGSAMKDIPIEHAYNDPLLNLLLEPLVAAWHEAIGLNRRGASSLREYIRSSNQSVVLYGSSVHTSAAELCKAQAALIKSALNEGGTRYRLQTSSVDYATGWDGDFLGDPAQSPGMLRWKGVRDAFRQEVRTNRFKPGKQQAAAVLPGCGTFSSPAKTGADEAARKAAREAEAAKKGLADAKAEAAKAKEQAARQAAGYKLEGTTLTYGEYTYDTTQFPEGLCPLHTVGLIVDRRDNMCDVEGCTLKHEKANRSFILNKVRRAIPGTATAKRDAQRDAERDSSGGGKGGGGRGGGGKRSGGGGRGGGSKRPRK